MVIVTPRSRVGAMSWMRWRVGAGMKGSLHLDIEIPRGDRIIVATAQLDELSTGLLGPSGSGKTSLLHLLSGLDQPTEGAVEIDGVDLFGLSERERTLRRREQVGYVFQFFNLLPNLSTRENIGLPLAITG